jgi:Uncharacterized protein conserved in bacteria
LGFKSAIAVWFWASASALGAVSHAAPQDAPQQTVPTSPPIYQPGAPGQPGRVISAETAVALSRSTHTADDARFMQHMIVHHRQAVEMVEMLQQHGQDPSVQLMGQRIALSQEAEMALMQTWLAQRGLPLEMPVEHDHAPVSPAPATMDHSSHAGHAGHAMTASPPLDRDEVPIMPGMLSPAQMRRLAAARGTAFDRLFLTGMIQHHQGALDMVTDLQRRPDSAEDAILNDFIIGVIADQSAEILRMQLLLASLDTPSS